MNPSSIALLKAVKDGASNPKELMEIIGVKEWQFNNLAKDLLSQDYIEKTDSAITFKGNSKTILFRDVASRFDVEKLLHDSNELVLQNLIEPKTINDIQGSTGLSLRTVQRAVSELESIGAAKRDGGGKVSLNRNHEPLYLFAEYLRTESEKKNVEPYTEIIYQDRIRTLKKVLKGKRVDGELTGFSLFPDYGIEYHTTHDYYVEQDSPLQLGEVLIHAVLAASKERDKHGIVMAMIFYLKNRQELDPLAIRPIAREYKISEIWVDMEGYLRNIPARNPDLFLPREEFEQKANLYAIPAANYTLPVAYPDLFRDIGQNIPSETEAYLLGGENMRLKGLKPRTKDCDLVVPDERSFNSMVEALKRMGYDSVNKSRLSTDDQRMAASDILEHPATRSRIDVFTKTVARKLVLSDGMKRRARMETHGSLKLGIMANEDVFLLKGVTLREGDIQDMAKLAQSSGFDWQVVWDEMERQEKDRSERFSAILLESLDYLYEQTGMRPPFYKKLERHVLDYEISRQVRGGKTLTEVISTLQGGEITEKKIRNRIGYMERKRFLKKTKRGNDVFLEPGERTVTRQDASNGL